MTFRIVLLVVITVIAPGIFTSHPAQNTEKSFDDGSVDYRGTTFKFDKAVASAVKAKTIEASPASEEAAPYDTIYPQHVSFELVGTYSGQPESFIKPEIHIYSVPDYQQAFAADPKAARTVTATINRMRQILRRRRLPTHDIPVLPIPDGYYAFRAHTSFLRFENGVGLAFLTQGQQDEMPVNNQNLSYEFQGMTDDGRFYVTAEFPVAAPLLPNNRDTADYGGTVKEAKCYQCPDHQRFLREYHAYVNRMKTQLQQLPPDKFQPSLIAFDNLLKSIRILDLK